MKEDKMSDMMSHYYRAEARIKYENETKRKLDVLWNRREEALEGGSNENIAEIMDEIRHLQRSLDR